MKKKVSGGVAAAVAISQLGSLVFNPKKMGHDTYSEAVTPIINSSSLGGLNETALELEDLVKKSIKYKKK